MVTARQNGMLFQNRLGYTSALDHWVLGFGIGAVSELPVLLAQNATDVTDWRSAVLAGDHPAESGVRLSLSESRERIAFANLGAHLSVSIADITTPLGVDLVRRLIEADLLSVSNEVARLNELGRQNWQYIVEASEDLWWLAV
jgi:coproporphyrinogen III oxidase-like Fe-S oxidoreductase